MMRPICLAGLAALVAACLPQPKTACLGDGDCRSGRICVSNICQSPRHDAGLDAGSGHQSPEDLRPDLAPFAVESAPEMPFVDALVSDVTDAPASRPSDASIERGLDAAADGGTFDGSSDSVDAPMEAPLPDDLPKDAAFDERALDSADLAPSSLDVSWDQGTERSDCGETGCPTNGWQLIGGRPASGPGVACWGPSKSVSVFWRGADDHLKHKWLAKNDIWSDEEDLGGTLISDPAATSRGTDMVDVFWQGPGGHLKHKWYRSGDQWSPEQDLGVTATSAPAAVSWEPFALFVFWRGTDGNLKQMSLDYASNSWSAEADLGIAAEADPAAMVRSYGIIDVFWRGAAGTLQHVWSFNGATWIGVQDLGGAIAADSSPTATARRDGWIDVLWRGPDNRAKHISMDLHSEWSSVEDLDGNLAGSPDATSRADGTLDVFARDALTGQIAHRVWSDQR